MRTTTIFQDGVSKINRIVWRACEQVAERAQAFAQEYKDDKVIYTVASGAGYGAAYLQSICIFYGNAMDTFRLYS
ncbi:putative phosphosugar isomerase [Salmonella enterica subsp. enterica serovar Daytona]|uniref:Putative phosphosugar isomerase n=1 Tax=Salmonella enterica subsp. enterica serovar Daytona TaxID=1962639 RepID=A0A447JAP4_SALET|nr:putative phosphosugar isomerase [Salmonella enterica subsp. enterica serovar Daytona]